MPPFICLRSQVKDFADDCIKPAFRRTIIIMIIIIFHVEYIANSYSKSYNTANKFQ